MPPPPAMTGLPTFRAQIASKSVDEMPAELRGKVTIPAGVEARAPIFLKLAEIVGVQVERARRYNYSSSADLSGFAVGYTDTDLNVSFTDFNKSWRCHEGFWRFCGGEILLTCTITVYVDERAKPADRRHCLEMIMTHELLHVRDEIDIVTNWLPREIPNDAFAKANLSPAARIPPHDFAARIRGNGDGRGSDLERRIQRELYIYESSNRAALLHRSRPQDTQQIGDCIRKAEAKPGASTKNR